MRFTRSESAFKGPTRAKHTKKPFYPQESKAGHFMKPILVNTKGKRRAS